MKPFQVLFSCLKPNSSLSFSSIQSFGLLGQLLVQRQETRNNSPDIDNLFPDISGHQQSILIFHTVCMACSFCRLSFEKRSECIFVPFVRSFVPILESSGSGSSKKSKRSFLQIVCSLFPILRQNQGDLESHLRLSTLQSRQLQRQSRGIRRQLPSQFMQYL